MCCFKLAGQQQKRHVTIAPIKQHCWLLLVHAIQRPTATVQVCSTLGGAKKGGLEKEIIELLLTGDCAARFERMACAGA